MKNIFKTLILITCLTTSVFANNEEFPEGTETFIGAKAKKALYANPNSVNFLFANGECVDTKKYLTQFNYEEDPTFTKKIKTNKEALDFILKREGVTKLEANYFFNKMRLILKYQFEGKDGVSVLEFFEFEGSCKSAKDVQ